MFSIWKDVVSAEDQLILRLILKSSHESRVSSLSIIGVVKVQELEVKQKDRWIVPVYQLSKIFAEELKTFLKDEEWGLFLLF